VLSRASVVPLVPSRRVSLLGSKMLNAPQFFLILKLNHCNKHTNRTSLAKCLFSKDLGTQSISQPPSN